MRRNWLTIATALGSMLGGASFGAAPPETGRPVRLGTPHLRAGCDTLHFSPDGKSLVGVNGGWLVRTWDAETGRLARTDRLPRRPPPNGWAIRSARSPDGK